MYASIEELTRIETSFSNHAAPLKQLRCGSGLQLDNTKTKKLLLKGHLCGFNKAGLCQVQLWHWRLKDQTGSMDALVCKRDLDMQGKEILCTKWNLIFKPKTKERWLEISEFVYIVTSPNGDTVEITPEVVGVTSALRLSRIRKELDAAVISVYGKIDSFSEIFRYREKEMFLLELVEGDVILKCLVQKDEYLHWQLVLVPGEKYVFSHLRPTSAFKGTEHEMIVCVPTLESKIVTPTTDLQLMSYQAFLQLHYTGNDCKLGEIPNHAALNTEYAGAKRDKFKTCSYKGNVSDCRNKHLGVFELDRQLRVFLGATCALNGFTHIREGMEITVHNVHTKHYLQDPRVRFYSCMRTCVTIHSCPEITASSQIDVESCKVGRYTPLYISMQYQQWRFDTSRSLQLQLCPKLVKEKDMCKMFEKVVQQHRHIAPEDNEDATPSAFNSDHKCTCTVVTKKVKGLPRVMSVADIKQIGEEEMDLSKDKQALVDDAQNTFTPQEIADRMYWKYVTISSEELADVVIIGQLKANKRTANLQIVDQTGIIDLICISHDETKSRDNKHEETTPRSQCACLGTMRNSNGPDSLSRMLETCDFMHIDALGSLLYISKFKLVFERFVACDVATVDELGVDNFRAKYEMRCCVQFSMQDVIYLTTGVSQLVIQEKAITSRDNNEFEPPTKRTKLSIATVQTEEDNVFVPMKAKGDPVRNTATGHKVSVEPKQLYFKATEIEMKSVASDDFCDDVFDTVLEAHGCVVQDFMVVHKDSLTVQSRGPYVAPQLSFFALVTYIGGARLCDVENATKAVRCDSPESTRRDSCRLYTQDIGLSFDGDGVRWYHLLHIGGVYSLIKYGTTDVTCFQSKFASQMLQRGVQRSRARQLVHVKDDVIVQHCDAQQGMEPVLRESRKAHIDDMKSVQSIMTDNGEEQLVNVSGVIARRTHAPHNHATHPRVHDRNDLHKIGASILQDNHIRLVIQDNEKPAYAISLYINTQRLSYALGLLPGARLVLYKVERKLSAAGKVYCQYSNASSCRVLGYTQINDAMDIGSELHTIDQMCAPEYLTTVMSTQHTTPQTVLLTVQRVLKVVLRYLCKACGKIVRETRDDQVTKCTCGSAALVVSAKASVLVEDGSSNAIAHCEDASVYNLLALNAAETQEFRSIVRKEGHIVLDKDDQDLTEIQSFLRLLCTSQSVRRRVVARVKKYSNMYKPTRAGAKPGWSNLTTDDLHYRTIGAGEKSFETLSLPMLHLDCLCLQEVDPTAIATALLCL